MTLAATMKRCNHFLEQHFKERHGAVKSVLEAGGGSFSHFHIPTGARLYVLDIEFGQLDKHTSANQGIQGDIHQLPLRSGCVDMIVCFNVLEHLDDPTRALDEIARALAPQGVLLLGCPERNSLKGWVTRLTPLAFHRWYYRRIVGKQDRGDGHYDAFATPFRPIVSGPRLKDWLAGAGMELLFFQAYDGTLEYRISTGNLKAHLFGLPYRLIGLTLRMLTLGRWHPMDSDLLLVAVRKPPQ